ncbi:MAG: hypothetical protein LBB51_01270 [Zoogloeaceae bacterium]|nr:hypothetical protein [Zoogloeaceae bacterium]
MATDAAFTRLGGIQRRRRSAALFAEFNIQYGDGVLNGANTNDVLLGRVGNDTLNGGAGENSAETATIPS